MPKTIDHITLVSFNYATCHSWELSRSDLDFVEVKRESITDVDCDALVVTGDSLGNPDGKFLPKYEEALKSNPNILQEDYDGELFVGQAILLVSKYTSPYYLVYAPTTLFGMKTYKETFNAYLSTRAALRCVLRANDLLKCYHGDPNAKAIKNIVMPIMGDSEDFADQMFRAIKEVLVDEPPYSNEWRVSGGMVL